MNETTTRDERKDAYERVLGIVEKNTGGQQPALMAESSLYVTGANAGLSGEAIGRAYRAAYDNDDLVKIRVNMVTRVCRRTESALREVIGQEHEKPPAERNEQLLDAVRDLIREVA